MREVALRFRGLDARGRPMGGRTDNGLSEEEFSALVVELDLQTRVRILAFIAKNKKLPAPKEGTGWREGRRTEEKAEQKIYR